MSPVYLILVGLVAMTAQDASAPPQQAPAAPGTAATSDPAEMLRQMNGQGAGSSVVITPQGRARRRAPRFTPFGIGAGGRVESQPGAMRPGVNPTMSQAPMPAGSGQVCNQQLSDEQRAANRSEAQAMTDTLNRMAELAAQMSAMQARQNGAQVTMGAVPRLDPGVTDALERMLNCDEQRQAADATERAIAAAPGTAVSWRSESRPNVSGSSTVIAVEAAAADGGQCLTVTDVIIIDGAETRSPKRMCRIPPSTRYVRA